MALPSTFDRITVVGKYLTLQGDPCTGSVTFTPPTGAWLKHLASDTVITPVTLTVNLDGAGSFTIALPITNDPDVIPAFSYTVNERITGPGSAATRTYNIELPVGLLPGPVDLSDLAPTGVVVAGTNVLTRQTADQLYIPGSTAGAASGQTLVFNAATNRFEPGTAIGGGGGGGGGGIPDDDSVSTAKLQSQSVTNAKIADNSVTNLKVANGAAISLDKTADSATRVAMTAVERTKLTGIGEGATANATNAQLRDRATHTGTQPASTISDFNEAAQDAISTLLAGASGIALSYNDAANTLTITGTGGGTTADAEAIRDVIGLALLGTGVISVVVNDALDTITITSTATANSTDAALRDRSTHTGSQAMSTITDLVSTLGGKADATHLHGVEDIEADTPFGTSIMPDGYLITVVKADDLYGAAGSWPTTRPGSSAQYVHWIGDTDPGVISLEFDTWTRT